MAAMWLTNANRRLRTSRCDHHLHREEFRKNEMLARGITRFPALRKMNRPNRGTSISLNEIVRHQRFQWFAGKFVQQPIDDAAQYALRKTFRRRIDRRDAPKVDRDFFVVLDYFELRVIHANPLPSQTRFAEDNEALPRGDHLLDIMQVKPTTHERLAQRARIRLLQRRLKNLFPSAETAQLCLDDFSAQADRHVALL